MHLSLLVCTLIAVVAGTGTMAHVPRNSALVSAQPRNSRREFAIRASARGNPLPRLNLSERQNPLLRKLYSQFKNQKPYASLDDGQHMQERVEAFRILSHDFNCKRDGPLAFYYAFILNKHTIYDLIAEVCAKRTSDLDAYKKWILKRLSLARSIGGLAVEIDAFDSSPAKFQEYIASHGLSVMIPLFALFGADINNEYLCAAAKKRHFDFVNQAIRTIGKYPVDPSGCILYAAAEALEVETVYLLMEYGTDPGIVGRQLLNALTSYTPVNLETSKSTYEILLLLLQNGLDPNLGRSYPLSNSIKNRRIDLVQLLIRAGATPTHRRLMTEAAAMGDVPMMRILHNHGAPYDDFFVGQTPLSAALRSKNLEAIDFLLRLGVDVNAHNGLALKTVLDQPEMIQYLLKFGLDLDVDMGENIITILKKGYSGTLSIYQLHGISWPQVLDRIATRCVTGLLPRLVRELNVKINEVALQLLSSCGPRTINELLMCGVRLDAFGGEPLARARSAEIRRALLKTGAFDSSHVQYAYSLLRQRGEPETALDEFKAYL